MENYEYFKNTVPLLTILLESLGKSLEYFIDKSKSQKAASIREF